MKPDGRELRFQASNARLRGWDFSTKPEPRLPILYLRIDTSPFVRRKSRRRRIMAITRRQKEVYDFLAKFVEENGYSPSFEEIGAGLGLTSLATVHKHISNLEQKGLLKRDYNRSRSIDLLKPRGRMRQALAGAASM